MMRCFSFLGSRIYQGILLDRRSSQYQLILGRPNSSSMFTRVQCFRKNPPEIEDGLMREAFILKFSTPEGNLLPLLAKPNKPRDDRILLRVQTYSVFIDEYDWNYSSGIEVLTKNEIEVVAQVRVAYGIYGEFGGWEDVLLELGKGAELKVSCENKQNFLISFSRKKRLLVTPLKP